MPKIESMSIAVYYRTDEIEDDGEIVEEWDFDPLKAEQTFKEIQEYLSSRGYTIGSELEE